MLGSYLGALQGQDSTEYDRLMDQVGYNRDQQSLYQAQVDAILQAGRDAFIRPDQPERI